MVRTMSRVAVPGALPVLIDRYAAVAEPPGRFMPMIWQQALRRRPPRNDLTALLRDADLTRPTAAGRTGRLRRRTVTWEALLQAGAAMDLADENDVLRVFVLAMAWCSTGAGPNGLRSTVAALTDPHRAHLALTKATRTLRAGLSLDDRALETTHHDWSLPMIGQSQASVWWSVAGHVPGRQWQPLVLDRRVYATLNTTLRIGGTARLAGTHRRPDRYRAYVETVHYWTTELRHRGSSVDAHRVVFVLAHHNGGAAPMTP